MLEFAPRRRILDLAANAGEAGALCAGFNAVRGALVLISTRSSPSRTTWEPASSGTSRNDVG